MQQDKELRIGNLVRNVDGTICIVSQLLLDERGINISVRCSPPNRRYGGMMDVISSVVLTTRILEAAGFTQNSEHHNRLLYTKNEVTLTENLQLCSFDGSMIITGKQIKFLHQLQNLYFLLSGQELEVNLDKII